MDNLSDVAFPLTTDSNRTRNDFEMAEDAGEFCGGDRCISHVDAFAPPRPPWLSFTPDELSQKVPRQNSVVEPILPNFPDRCEK
jgi:hypothetical protein